MGMGILNACLLLGSLCSVGVRYIGFTVLLVAVGSCGHVIGLGLIFGSHVLLAANNGSGGPSNNSDIMYSSSSMVCFNRVTNLMRNASARYGTDVYIHGFAFGVTLMMAMLMHIISLYYGGLSSCVASAASSALSSASASSSNNNLTGGYSSHNMQQDISNGHHTNTMGAAAFDPYNTCGASGPVGFVSFISGLLFWFNSVLTVVLYAKREEIAMGGSAGGAGQYDEIGASAEQQQQRGFAGDFPQTMNV